jgi:diguanylate cyclase (GGDEF)-like protein
MSDELSFDGFNTLIRNPLEKNDPRSYELIKNLLLNASGSFSDPFESVIQQLTNVVCTGEEAREYWRCILNHKHDMEIKLGRRVGISAASIDYFDTIENGSGRNSSGAFRFNGNDNPLHQASRDEAVSLIHSSIHNPEILKQEMLRAKRYKHALSVIMLDVDNFSGISKKMSSGLCDELLIVIIKIIRKTIRSVDIIFRYSPDRFLVILPNTNKREAQELAERLRRNVCERTKRIRSIEPYGVTVTLSVGQMANGICSGDFIKQLETILEDGKRKKNDAVYCLEP